MREARVVSVVIPTYKRAEYLPRALESVLSQQYPSVEAVVVDDNGEGTAAQLSTAQVLSAYADRRVRYVVNPRNLGGALARNAGIEAASGYYVTFLDDDDEYLPGKIAVQAEKMDERGWDMSFMDADICGVAGTLIDMRRHIMPEEPDRAALIARHLIEHLTPTATFMFTAEALRRIGSFEPSEMGHEYMLMLKAIERGLRIGYIPRSLVRQYAHPGERITTGDKKAEGEKRLYALKRRYFDYLTPAQRRSVSARHYATLFYVHLKRRELPLALYNGISAALSSPVASLALLRDKRKMML
jgi:glycosyltransferase involved in cell wall biosynthesis